MNRHESAPPPAAAPHDEARIALGALVLGALTPGEREVVEAHVAACPECTAELAELATLPGLLARLRPEEADAAIAVPASGGTEEDDGPDPLLERLLARAHAESRTQGAGARPEEPGTDGTPAPRSLADARARRRRITAWTLAVVSAAAGAAWLLVAGPLASVDRAPAVVVVEGHDRQSQVRGEVTLTSTPNGTELAVVLDGVEPGEECRIEVVRTDGERDTAAAWEATYLGEARVTGSTRWPIARIDRLEITTPDGRTLLELPVLES
jgi:anti-sigma factor RsiW